MSTAGLDASFTRFDQLALLARQQNVLSTVLLELTYQCNLDCSFCYNDLDLKGKRVSLQGYKSLLDDLAEMNVMMLTLSGGEPMLYEHFFELGQYARQKGFIVTIKTNGLPLNQHNAERLKSEVDPYNIETSIHGATAATHDRLTQVPGSFERLIRNVRILKSLGMRVNLNSTLTAFNEGEVEQMLELADELGYPLRFNPEVSPRDNGDMAPLSLAASPAGLANMMKHSILRVRKKAEDNLLFIDEPVMKKQEGSFEEKTIKPEAKKEVIKNKICGAGSTYLAIDPFGTVHPCVQFRRNAGNIHNNSIKDIWANSQGLSQVRTTAEQAYEKAQSSGVSKFCMGLAELHSGDPLNIPESALESDSTFKRLNWEIFGPAT